MEKVRSAIVGCGGIAQVHAKMLGQSQRAQAVAYADCKPERAQALAEQYGGKAYGSLEELLENEQIDCLHICTPHYLHLPMAQEAQRRGIAVFTEKPPVIDRAQWAAFQKLSVPVGICFQNRFNDSVAHVEELLAAGRPGKILGARAFVTWRREAPYYTESGWRGALSTEGGGALINQAIHTLDLLVRFLGPARSAQATAANHHLKGVIEVEDTLEAYIQFQNANALFFASTAHCVDAPILLELVCEAAVIRIEGEEVAVRWKDGAAERRDFSQTGAGKAYWGSSHGRCMDEFYRCLAEGTPFINSISGVADTINLMLDMYDSAR